MNNDRPLTGKFKKWLIQNKSSLPGLRVIKSYIQVVSKVCIAVAGLFLRNVNDFSQACFSFSASRKFKPRDQLCIIAVDGFRAESSYGLFLVCYV